MLTMTTKQKLTAATKQVAVRARAAGRRAAARIVAAADTVLVTAGDAAKARQRKRGATAALKRIGKAALIAATAAGTAIAARAAVHAVRDRKTTTP
jgi:hypothetical protein